MHHFLSPDTPKDTPAIARHLQDIDSDDGDYGEDEWDPHTSTKPSPLDREASDEQENSDNEVDVKSEAFNYQMVNKLSELQDNNLCDHEWKPSDEQKKRRGQFRIMH